MSYSILLSGKNGAGKDTLGDYLKGNYYINTISFANALKDMFCKMNSITRDDLVKHKNLFRREWKLDTLKEIDEVLYNKMVSCDIHQHFPNELNNGLVEFSKLMLSYRGDHFWCDEIVRLNKNIIENNNENIIITDCRKLLEIKYFDSIKVRKKVILVRILENRERLELEGYKFPLDCPFECELDNYKFNYTIDNIGSFENLYKQGDQLMSKLAIKRKKK